MNPKFNIAGHDKENGGEYFTIAPVEFGATNPFRDQVFATEEDANQAIDCATKSRTYYVIFDRTKKRYYGNGSWTEAISAATQWSNATMACSFINYHRDGRFSSKDVARLSILMVTETYQFKNVLYP